MKAIADYDFKGVTLEVFKSYLKDYFCENGVSKLNDRSSGETLLHYAVTQNDFILFAEVLIKAGANWWSVKNQEQQTVMQLANDSLTADNFEKLVSVILEKAKAYSKHNVDGFNQLNAAAELLIEFSDKKTIDAFEKAGKEFFGKLTQEALSVPVNNPSKAERFATQPTKQRVFDKPSPDNRSVVLKMVTVDQCKIIPTIPTHNQLINGF